MTINQTDQDRGAALPPPQEIDNAYPLVLRPDPPSFAGDPGQLAAQAISDVLGWKWRGDDTQGFQAALAGSFELHKVQGHTEATWTPRGYAIQADLGAVTGGQASLAARARSAIKDSLALLKSLRTLRPTADLDNAEGFRALVQHELEEILKELESPMIRVPRVDQLFVQLLGKDPRPDAFDGHLKRLGEEFGLSADNVNTIEEERIQTSFVTLVDWVVSLQRGWQDARSIIDPFVAPPKGETPYFGPAVLALSQLLSAVAAQVDEVNLALRSVGVQSEEVDVLRIPLPADGGSMSLGGLLRWVSGFATDEGRKLIESAGKEGVSSAFYDVASLLASYVGNLPRADGHTPRPYRATLPTGFFSFRVQRAIDELTDHLEVVVEIAKSIRQTSVADPRPGPAPQPQPQPAPPAVDPPAAASPAARRPSRSGRSSKQGAAKPEGAPPAAPEETPPATPEGARPAAPPQPRARTTPRERPDGTDSSAAK